LKQDVSRHPALVQSDLTIYINNNMQLFAFEAGRMYNATAGLDRAVQVALSRWTLTVYAIEQRRCTGRQTSTPKDV